MKRRDFIKGTIGVAALASVPASQEPDVFAHTPCRPMTMDDLKRAYALAKGEWMDEPYPDNHEYWRARFLAK